MCDACEHPLRRGEDAARPDLQRHATTSSDPSVDADDARLERRALLRRAAIGGLGAAAASLWLPEALAEAVAPPFEYVQLGEDRLPKLVPAAAVPAAVVPAAVVPAAVVPAAPVPAAVTPAARRRSSSGGFGPPPIVTRAEWGADESIRSSERGFAPIRKIVVHHTASRNKPRNPVEVVRLMYRYHVLGRGFSDVGYNFAIDHRGTVYEGRWARNYGSGELHDGEDRAGYGVVGAHALGVNAGSCGIVLIGDFTKAVPTNAALASLIELIAWKAAVHQIDPLRTEEYISIFGLHRTFPNIAGHRQTGQTICPGRGLYNQLGFIRNEVANRVGRFPAKTIDMSKALRWTQGQAPAASAFVAGPSPANPTGAKLTGYRLLTAEGRVITLGKAAELGSPRQLGEQAVTAIAGVPGRNSYITASTAGRVLGFGGAPNAAPRGTVQAADVASTPSGKGSWVLTTSGGVYAFGSARHHGSLMRSGISAGGVKLRPTPSGNGYWILAGNGRVYAFGDAPELSSPPAGAVDLWPTPTGQGYWVVLGDGRVGAYGDAGYFGDVPSLGVRWTKPAVAIVGMPSGRGYAIAARDGGMFNFGSSPFLGSLGGSGRRVVGMALAFG